MEVLIVVFLIAVFCLIMFCFYIRYMYKAEIDEHKGTKKELAEAGKMFDKLDKIKNKVEYVTIPAYQIDDMDYNDQIRAIGENKYWIFFMEHLKRQCVEAISTLDNESHIKRSKSGLVGIKYIEDAIKTRIRKYEDLKNEKV